MTPTERQLWISLWLAFGGEMLARAKAVGVDPTQYKGDFSKFITHVTFIEGLGKPEVEKDGV